MQSIQMGFEESAVTLLLQPHISVCTCRQEKHQSPHEWQAMRAVYDEPGGKKRNKQC